MLTTLQLGQALFKECMKDLEVRAFILASSVYKDKLPLPTTMSAVDHVETCLKAAIETWAGDAGYDYHGGFVRAVVRSDWEAARASADGINETFMSVYMGFVSVHLPLVIIEHFKNEYK